MRYLGIVFGILAMVLLLSNIGCSGDPNVKTNPEFIVPTYAKDTGRGPIQPVSFKNPSARGS